MRKFFLIPALIATCAFFAVETSQAAQPEAGGAAAKNVVPVAVEPPADGKLRIIVFGAHPDDAELTAGGTAALWNAQGHHVKLVSVTNGDIGHYRITGAALAERRKAEVEAADKMLGAATQVLPIHDGELMPTLENRREITRLIRDWGADIVIAHRPFDYHPDHRYVGILVQDSAFMVTVPFFCPETPYLTRNPVFLTPYDRFLRPVPSAPDVVVAIDEVVEKKVDAVMLMESQFVDGGATGYNSPLPDNDPAAREARRQNMRENMHKRFEGTANRWRDKLIELYGEELGKKIRYAEAFEVCEYGRRPTPDELRKLFPFFPPKK